MGNEHIYCYSYAEKCCENDKKYFLKKKISLIFKKDIESHGLIKTAVFLKEGKVAGCVKTQK